MVGRYMPNLTIWIVLCAHTTCRPTACKPAFLNDDNLSIFRVDDSGSLWNVEDKTVLSPQYLRANGIMYQGGNWKDIHRILSIASADKVCVQSIN